MEIEEHLEQHKGVLQAKAVQVARQAGILWRRGRPWEDGIALIEDIFAAGQQALRDVHSEPGYDHGRAQLLTYAWKRVLSAMRQTARQGKWWDDNDGEEYEASGFRGGIDPHPGWLWCEQCPRRMPPGKRGQRKRYCSQACTKRASRKRRKV
jgi:hypothetical protein